MTRYYYIDKNGNKKYYKGKINYHYNTNTYIGQLPIVKYSYENVDLDYHEEIPYQEGWNSYFMYKDTKEKYIGNLYNIKENYDNTYFITKITQIQIPVKKYDEIKSAPSYFSYIDSEGNEQIYTDKKKPLYDKKTSTYYLYK